MSAGKCQYSGSGAGAGRTVCEFFTAADAHPGVKWTGITVCLIILFFCLRYLKTGKAPGLRRKPGKEEE